MDRYKLSIDIGGTFIDVVLFDFESRKLSAFKLPTTPHDPAEGVISAIDELKIPAEQIFDFIHGTTLGLNAILERKGTQVGILTNEGFRDLFEISRGSLEFQDMYRFDYDKPLQIVERRHTRGVRGRMDYLGNEVLPLDADAVVAAARELHEAEGCKAIAVSFLHSYANPAHEDEAVRLIRTALPGCEVSSGVRLANEYREYERTSTAVMDAYIKPVLKNYLGRVAAGMEGKGFGGNKYVMNSSGGAMTFSLANAEPIATVLSGPAGGVSGAIYVSRATERPNVISVDVGGTSLDACLIVDNNPVDVFEARIDTFPILQPIFDLRTLGAGGGSIAWIDNKLLRVGPQSAGAVPGPACYGRGGTNATVTDAAVVLGYIDTTNFMGGRMEVAYDRAATAIRENIADKLGIGLEEAAQSIFDVLISRTSSSVKEMMLEKGLDPRDFAMLAFGGCGPLFGPMLFDQLDMGELVVPPLPSVFSAWGMMASDLNFSDALSVMETVAPAMMPRLAATAADLAAKSTARLIQDIGKTVAPEANYFARIRFIGQEHTLNVAYRAEDSAEALFQRFSDMHRERFGHTFDSDCEIVSLMVKLVIPTLKPELSAGVSAALDGAGDSAHRMYDPASAAFVDCLRINRDRLKQGETYPGPVLIVDEGSSLPLFAGQVATLDAHGMISVKRVGE